MKNKSFRIDFENPHQNAMVGEHWIGDIRHAYREGFKQATLALLAVAAAEFYEDPNTEEAVHVYVDAIVYPICFNARHFIELFLKDSIRIASVLRSSKPPENVVATHDLSDLWCQFAVAIASDKRLVKLGMPLKEVFADIAAVDNTGMTFRYAHDREENAHLPGLEYINLGVLGDRLRQMFTQAEEFSLMLDILQQEYSQQTFTSKVHRGEIEAIARQLPPYEKWAEELKPVKKKICAQYNLTSNDFGRVLKIIRHHREFANLVELELPLNGLPADVFERLARVHAGDAPHSLLTKDEWLNLEAVMEMNNYYRYSEEYDWYVGYLSSPDYEGRFDPPHLVRNAYARNQRLRGGLIKLGQKTLLAALSEAIPHLAKPVKIASEEEMEDVSERLMRSFKKHLQQKKGDANEPGDSASEQGDGL